MRHEIWWVLAIAVSISGLVFCARCFAKPDTTDGMGTLEIECNIAGIHLSLCPKSQFHKKEETVLFGLFTKSRHVCSEASQPLGVTPIAPLSLPAGTYILLVPQGYFWEGEPSYQVVIKAGKKTYCLLKLFTHEGDHGGSGGGGGGAAAR